MDINFEMYKVFYHIAVNGSITKASQKLHISQPAVSQSIKNLENALGGTLFHRTSKGILLTNEGKSLFDYISKAYNLIKAGEDKHSKILNLSDGEISIGASDTICKYVLMPHLSKFASIYSNIRINVTNKTSMESIGMLKNGQVDFCLVNMPLTEQGIDFINCKTIHDIPICGTKFAKHPESPLDFTKLACLPLCLLGKETSTRAYIETFFSSNNIEINPEFELGSIDLLIEFARSNLGISFVVKEFANQYIDNQSLFTIQLNNPLPPRNIAVATLKGVSLSHAAKEFINNFLLL